MKNALRDVNRRTALGAVLVVLTGAWFYGRRPDDATAPTPAASPVAVIRPPNTKRLGSQRTLTAGIKEFRPTLLRPNPEAPPKNDPTIRVQRLNQLRAFALVVGGRSLFDFDSIATVVAVPREMAHVGAIIPFHGPVQPAAPKQKHRHP